MSLKKKAVYLAAATSISLLAGSVTAQDGKVSSALGVFSNADGSQAVQSFDSSPVPQGLDVECVSMENLASWDFQGDADNIVIELDIGAGNRLIGAGFDMGIETVGISWLSEVTILHSDSTAELDPNGIVLTPAFGENSTGNAEYSSGGLVIFADIPLSDVVAGPDGILRLEIHETGFDDNPDAIDANLRNHSAPAVCGGLALVCSDQEACNAAIRGGPLYETQPVPVNTPWALGLLVLLLATLGTVAIRRIA